MSVHQPTAYEDDGSPCCVTMPEYLDDDPAEAIEGAVRAGRAEAIGALVDWLVAGQPDAQAVGRRAAMLAYIAKTPTAPRSQRALARLLRISAARVNTILREIRRQLRESGLTG